MDDSGASETERLFDLCDRERKGYLVVADLRNSCPQLSRDNSQTAYSPAENTKEQLSKEIDFIFKTLDSDDSGKIERKEFVEGFKDALGKKEINGTYAHIIRINDKSVTSTSSNETGYSSDEAAAFYSQFRSGDNLGDFQLTDSENYLKLTQLLKSLIAYLKGNLSVKRGEEVYHSESESSIPIDLTIPW
uniref:EF-hand domain-containing protein n=1 Tax=Syphacia muris TaxID=451379 RepID=A0A0N5A8T5_9BILA